MRNKTLFFIIIFLLVAIFSILELIIGPYGARGDIILKIRLPRLMLAIFVGGSLGVSGAALQGVLENPLADPYILGISGGACVGATISILSGVLPPQVLSLVFAVITIFIVYRIACFGGKILKEALLLAGIVIGTLASSIVMLAMSIADKGLEEILYLLLGNLGMIFEKRVFYYFCAGFAVSIIMAFIIYRKSRELNILSLGEEEALGTGVDVEKLKKTIFVASSLMVGLTVSFVGAIGFIGLMVPHITRRLIGPDHRTLIPGSCLIGIIFVIISDIFARTVCVYELPVGVITSLFGVPFFIYLLRKRGK